MERVYFTIANPEENSSHTETLWAEKVHDSVFRIKNIPFYVYGIAFDDVVKVLRKESIPEVLEVVERSGNSTYRIILLNHEKWESEWQKLEPLECTYEEGDGIIAINVPANQSIHAVFDLLEKGEERGIWEFEEGFCGHV